MKTSMKGLLAILAEEAVVLSTYIDSGGVPTVGAGHTAAAGAPIPKPGLKLTLREAFDVFAKDLAKFEARVNQAIKVPLEQHEFDALVSFDLNTGAIDHGTVDDKMNRGDRLGAMMTLRAYHKDNGKVIPGLVARREREAAMFQHGAYPDRPVLVYDRYPGKARSLTAEAFLSEVRVAAPAPVPTTAPQTDPMPVPPPLPPAGVPANGVAAIIAAALGLLIAIVAKLFGGF
jgi:lysozyme